ncbi:aldo/keto reductase [Nonomuraea sp. NPDC049607]|uniref:aldo/keto reductase n=1 Tax=Nonomuraea sp. NPDC049607 TaxID=3154732 RepID=UPI003438671F
MGGPLSTHTKCDLRPAGNWTPDTCRGPSREASPPPWAVRARPPEPDARRMDRSRHRTSIEDSLKRLGVDRLDIVWVHDIVQDFHGDVWLQKFEEARTRAFRVLARLRDEGVIRGRGLGVNRTEPIELTLALDEPQPDGFLLAGRYTLLDHEHALQRLPPPMAEEQDVSMVVGGPYSSGVLAGGTHFEYQQAPPEIVERVGQIKALAERYGVSIKAAALQFSLAHPVAVAAVPGATRPSRIAEDVAALNETVPAAFWEELRALGLVSPAAPLPGGA